METMNLAMVCAECGSSHITTHANQATCSGCGAELGDMDVLREQARAAVFDALREDFQALIQPPARPVALPLAA